MNKERIKNIWMWIGLLGVIFASANIPFETLTSWEIFFESILGILSNPFQLTVTAAALVGVVVNPTSPGLYD